MSIQLKIMLIILLLFAVAFGYVYRTHPGLLQLQEVADNKQLTMDNRQQATDNKQQATDNKQLTTENGQQAVDEGQKLPSPIDNAVSRVTKKPFGIFVTPNNSPVQPERFQGYHSGTDFETTPEEQNVEVPIKTICEGKLLEKRFASGYGGLAAQACMIDNEAVTVVYGHLRLSSIVATVGDNLKAGYFLGNLGTGYSKETDGERKHLHLGIHKGSNINILGYVQSKNQLAGWLDACAYVCK